MKSPTRNVIKAHLAQIAQLACRVPLIRLHPKLRWLEAVCPIVEQIGPDEVPRKRRKKRRHKRSRAVCPQPSLVRHSFSDGGTLNDQPGL